MTGNEKIEVFCNNCHLPMEDCECPKIDDEFERDDYECDHADWLIDPDMGDQ